VTIETSGTANPIAAAAPIETARPVYQGTALLLTVAASVGALAVDQVSKAIALSRLLAGPSDFPGPIWFDLVANRGA